MEPQVGKGKALPAPLPVFISKVLVLRSTIKVKVKIYDGARESYPRIL
jgi:hypothetical protein